MISRQTIGVAIDKAHEHLESAWQTIFPSDKNTESSGQTIVECQIKLIEALWILDAQYRAVGREKRRLILNKSNYVTDWFTRRMATLDGYLKILRSEIGSAKVVGDGYAWIFYRSDDILIDEHLKQQRQVNLPPGVGGIGERAFVEKAQGLNGHFILYHGITSYLRLGDITFFDPANRRVKSIGELKSEQIGEHQYRITLGFVYGAGIESPIDIATLPSNNESKPRELPPDIASRLSKQLSGIRRAVTKVKEAEANPVLKAEGKYYFQELDEVIAESRIKGFAYRKASESLVLGAIRVDGELASTRAFRKLGNLKKQLDPVQDVVRTILDPGFSDNCIFFGTVGHAEDGFPIVLPGTIPLMWWPLSKENLHDLTFGKVVVFSFYNPAHFWNMLRGVGYTVNVDNRSRFLNATKRDGKRIAQLVNMDYFRKLSSHFLMSEETIMSMLGKVSEQFESQAEGTRIKINLVPRMKQ